jgi:ribonuclease P protein component
VEQQQLYTLGKEERLKSRKQIEHLFKTGKRLQAGSIKVFHQLQKEETSSIQQSLQFAVGVGTKHFKHAVDRNRIKRLIREAYRLQKNELKDIMNIQNKQLNLFFIYTGKEMPLYETIQQNITMVLTKLMEHYK